MFRRVVNVAEALVALGAVAFVILLFANNPGGVAGSGSVGAQLFGGRVLRDFPNEPDEVTFVANGRGIMPGFATALTPAQLKAVVDYTRTGLAK